MSLDVYLTLEGATIPEVKNCIFIREGGSTKQITREEWDRRFPGREPATVSIGASDEVYTANITHNLNKMADAAGIYQYLWRPDEINISQASQLIEPLQVGLELLLSDPERFKAFNPSNGWGDYEGLCLFVGNYLQACRQFPDATVSVWR